MVSGVVGLADTTCASRDSPKDQCWQSSTSGCALTATVRRFAVSRSSGKWTLRRSSRFRVLEHFRHSRRTFDNERQLRTGHQWNHVHTSRTALAIFFRWFAWSHVGTLPVWAAFVPVRTAVFCPSTCCRVLSQYVLPWSRSFEM